MSTISTGTLLTTAFKVTSDLSGTLQIQTGASSANAVYIGSNQNVGIGTITPSSALEVVGTITATTIAASSATVGSDTITTNTATQTLQNKTLDNTNTVTVKDTLFTLQDDADTTKQAQFQLSGIATATTSTYTLPAATTTLAGLGTTQTFSGNNTFSGNMSLTSASFTRTATNLNWLDGSMTTATWTVGGTTQTGAITLGRSTGIQTLNLATGATTAATTKTINIGTTGVSTSVTNITSGSSVAGALVTHTWNAGANNMTLNSDGNVGIGLTNPSVRLDVVGASNVSATIIKAQGALPDNNDNAGLYVLHQGTAGAGLRVRTDAALTGTNFAHIFVNNASASINGLQVSQYGTGYIASFDKSGTVAMRIDSSGNVGIGTTSPVDLLTVNRASGSGVTSGISLTTAAGSAGDGSYIKWTGAGAGEKIARIDGVQEGTDTGSIRFNTGNGADGFAERMRITSAGLVGIGTSAPVTKLTVNGDTNISAASAGNSYKLYFGDEVTSGPGKGIFMEGYYMKIQGHRNEGIRLQGVNAAGAVQEFANFYGDANASASQIHLLPGGAGAVCIGTTSTLGARVAIHGTGGGTNNYIQITNPGIGTACIGLGATGSNVKFYNSYTSGTIGTGAGIDIDTNGNVGIGTTGPSAPLEVNGTATAVRATSAQLWLSRTTAATHYQGICLRNGAAFDAFIGRPPAIDDIIFGFDAGTVLSEKMRINTSGNVGIGTSSPSKKLEVYAAANSLQILSVVRNDNAGTGVAAIGFNTSSAAAGEATSTKAGIGLVRGVAFGGGALAFYNNNSGAAGDFTTADEKMRIDSSGNVGIGTSSPNSKLNVAGRVFAGGSLTSNSGDSDFNAGGSRAFMDWNGSLARIGTVVGGGSGGPVAFYVNGGESARIDTTGRLIIGAATANASESKLEIRGPANTGLSIYMLKATQVEVNMGFGGGGDSNFYINSGSATIGTSGVYLPNVGNSWSSVSDERMKTIVEPIENASAKVATLRTVIGYFNNDTTQTRRPFLIAQDVQAVLPEAVNVQDVETGTLGMSYTDTIPLLVAAINELKAIVDAQTVEINALKAKVGT